MAQNYEDIVREWYTRLRPEFLRRLTAKYSSLSLYDAENLYQDTFIAVQENLMLGRVKEDTSWSSYIMTIGMNMASTIPPTTTARKTIISGSSRATRRLVALSAS